MPIIDHSKAPEVPWRTGYRKWDITQAEHGVTSTFSLNTAEPGAGAPLHTHVMDKVVGDQSAQLLVFFPTLEPYSPEHTHYLEGAAPSSVKG